jgi:ribosomal protein S27E
VKIKLVGCEHKKLHAAIHAPAITCLSCYRRLWTARDAHGNPCVVPAAPAPPLCTHAAKTPISEQITRNFNYYDAVCNWCGVVLRHPDGKGAWEEVMFYGHLISEEP